MKVYRLVVNGEPTEHTVAANDWVDATHLLCENWWFYQLMQDFSVRISFDEVV